MRMADPKSGFAYIVSQIVKLFPNFSYIHVVEPRVAGNVNREPQEGEVRIQDML